MCVFFTDRLYFFRAVLGVQTNSIHFKVRFPEKASRATVLPGLFRDLTPGRSVEAGILLTRLGSWVLRQDHGRGLGAGRSEQVSAVHRLGPRCARCSSWIPRQGLSLRGWEVDAATPEAARLPQGPFSEHKDITGPGGTLSHPPWAPAQETAEPRVQAAWIPRFLRLPDSVCPPVGPASCWKHRLGKNRGLEVSVGEASREAWAGLPWLGWCRQCFPGAHVLAGAWIAPADGERANQQT